MKHYIFLLFFSVLSVSVLTGCVSSSELESQRIAREKEKAKALAVAPKDMTPDELKQARLTIRLAANQSTLNEKSDKEVADKNQSVDKKKSPNKKKSADGKQRNKKKKDKK